MSTRRRFCAALLALALLPGASLAVPKAELWSRWKRTDKAATRVLDHTLWSRFLSTYVVASPDGINRVRYREVSGDDAGYLRVYLDQLQRTEVSKLRREEQLAYWINLYNAQAAKIALDRYPVASMQDISISPGLWTKGPWEAKLLKVEDETLSLDDIEHRILRPIWKDPRIHYALTPSALGGPQLMNEAYTASNTDVLLDIAARAFVNHPRGVSVDDRGRVVVSSLYTWFKEDFGGSDEGVIAHLLQYAEPELAEPLKQAKKIRSAPFDWGLNDVRPPADDEDEEEAPVP